MRLDPSLPETGATIVVAGEELARVDAATGSPARPMPPAALADKVARLGAEHLAAMVEAPGTGARELVARAFEAGPRGFPAGRVTLRPRTYAQVREHRRHARRSCSRA